MRLFIWTRQEAFRRFSGGLLHGTVDFSEWIVHGEICLEQKAMGPIYP
jgi:hypothetical protein